MDYCSHVDRCDPHDDPYGLLRRPHVAGTLELTLGVAVHQLTLGLWGHLVKKQYVWPDPTILGS